MNILKLKKRDLLLEDWSEVDRSSFFQIPLKSLLMCNTLILVYVYSNVSGDRSEMDRPPHF